MSETRKIKKTFYALAAAISVLAGTLTGYTAAEPERDFYREPYTSHIFGIQAPAKGAERFSDMTKDDWFYVYVDGLVKDGIINGKSEYEYDPQGTLTLPECAALLVRCLGLEKLAESEKAKLAAAGAPGSDRWYMGYLKVCVDANVIPEDVYGFGYDENGAFVMTSTEYEAVPVKRYELAEFIYRMTLLDGSGVRAENTYSERGGYGHEFIRSGLYDMEAVSLYRQKIADFQDIPEAYRQGVLACYYNGIFNGGTDGKFNPLGSLTRAEMAKTVAVLTDISQRFGEDLRSSAYVIQQADIRRDIYGASELTSQAGYRILETSASLLAVLDSGYLRVPVAANAPMGYAVEAHVYEGGTEGFAEIGSVGIGTEGIYRSGDFCDFGISAGKAMKVIYVLRDIADGGEVEGVLEAALENGNIVFSDGISRPKGSEAW